MIRVTVDSIRVSLLTQHRVVVLREADSRRYLPIWIGAFEADAIALALQGYEPQRPMTHDLLKTVFTELGATITHILISDIDDSTFFARIVIEQNGSTREIDARPSDAIALAVRTDIPIYVSPHVFERAGTTSEDAEPASSYEEPNRTEEQADTEPDNTDDETLSPFREFINSLKFDDDEGKKDKQ
jgi:bifunctional DNase/RNase